MNLFEQHVPTTLGVSWGPRRMCVKCASDVLEGLQMQGLRGEVVCDECGAEIDPAATVEYRKMLAVNEKDGKKLLKTIQKVACAQ